jgi:hypothetical protein
MKRVNSQKSIASNSSANHDHVREQIRKQLVEAFDLQDSVNESKYEITEVADFIEKEIYNLSEGDVKGKLYRDKCKKIIMRLKGKRNQHIRQMLREGGLDIALLCKMSDVQLDDDNQFKKVERVRCAVKPPRARSVMPKRVENELLTYNV